MSVCIAFSSAHFREVYFFTCIMYRLNANEIKCNITKSLLYECCNFPFDRTFFVSHLYYVINEISSTYT